MQQDDVIVGFAIVMDDLLHLIMVDVPYQRMGYGAALLAYVEREMFMRYPVSCRPLQGIRIPFSFTKSTAGPW